MVWLKYKKKTIGTKELQTFTNKLQYVQFTCLSKN